MGREVATIYACVAVDVSVAVAVAVAVAVGVVATCAVLKIFQVALGRLVGRNGRQFACFWSRLG